MGRGQREPGPETGPKDRKQDQRAEDRPKEPGPKEPGTGGQRTGGPAKDRSPGIRKIYFWVEVAHIYFYYIFALGNEAKTKPPYNEFTKAN